MGLIHKIQKSIYGAAQFFQETKEQLNKILYPPMGIYGTSGIEIQGQQIYEEQLAALQNLETRCNYYDKMEKTEQAIRLAFLVYQKPILSATTNVTINQDLCEKYKINDKLQNDMMDCVKYNLLERNIRQIKKQRNEHLQFKKYGFSISEIVWGVEDNNVIIDDLQFRHPRTILWNLDDNENLVSVEQHNYYGNKKVKPIPKDKLLLFNQNNIGSNYEGISDLRFMFRPYNEKDQAKRLIMIALQRFAVGMPIIQSSQESRQQDLTPVHNFLKKWNSFEQSAGALPYGWEAKFVESGFQGAALANIFLDRLDREMFMAALAIFVLPTLKGSGSLALSQDATDFFGMALQSDSDLITDVYNYEMIPRLIDHNFSDVKVYPRIELTVKEQDVQQLLNNIVLVKKEGILPVCKEMQEKVGSLVDLEEVNWEKVNEEKKAEEQEKFDREKDMFDSKNPVVEDKPGEEDKLDIGKKPKEKEVKPETKKKSETLKRELTEHEKVSGGIKMMKEKRKFLDNMQDKFLKAVGPIVEKQVNAVLKYAKTHHPDSIMTFEVPEIEKYQKAVKKYYIEATTEGANEIARQAGKSVPSFLHARIEKAAKQKSVILSQRAADDLRFFVAGKIMQLAKDKEDMTKENEKILESQILLQNFNKFLEEFSGAV